MKYAFEPDRMTAALESIAESLAKLTAECDHGEIAVFCPYCARLRQEGVL